MAAARKEGRLSWVDAVIVPSSARKIAAAFKKRYGLPDFTVDFVRQNTGQLSALVSEEVKAHKVTFDVFGVASPRLFYDLKDAGALMHYESPEYKHFIANDKKAGLTFEPGYWISPVAYVYAPVTNPKLYEKQITSWYDLLDPKLKGHKISWPHVATSEAAVYHYYGLRKVLPLSFFENLAKQELSTGNTSVPTTAMLTTGQLYLAVTTASRMYPVWEKTGVALRANYPKEGVPLFGHAYGILAKAPHPAAAQLFIDFLDSAEGQNLYVKLEGIISAREGIKVPKEVEEYSPQLSKIKTIPMDWKNISDAELKAARNEFTRIFTER